MKNRECTTPGAILLCGFYGRGNFGDDLMGISLAEFLIEEYGYQVAIAAADPAPFRNLPAGKVRFLQPGVRSLLAELGRIDVLCQGGGSVFHDAYEGPYRYRYRRNLLLWAGLFFAARLRKVEVILLGTGIGPFRSAITRLISRLALAQCRAIGVRDQASANSFAELGSSTPLFQGQDLAMLRADSVRFRTVRNPSARRTLGISVCSLAPFLKEPQQEELYWRMFAEALAIFSESQDCSYVFFSLFEGQGLTLEDKRIADQVISYLPGKLSARHCVYAGNPTEFRDAIGACDWFIAAKYHAAVAAYLAGADLAVIPYHRKLYDLADEIGLPESRRVNIHEPVPVAAWLSLLQTFTQPAVAKLLPTRIAAEQARACVSRVIRCVLPNDAGAQHPLT